MRLTDVLCIRKVQPFTQCDNWFKRNQLMKFAFLYNGRTARCHKLGINRVYKALQYVRTARDARKAEAKHIWNERISIASEQCGLPNAKVLQEGLSQSNILLDGNILQILAIYEPRTFSALTDIAKQYHIEKGVALHGRNTSAEVISRGLLQFPIVPGNQRFYE
ncbi:hypothetical protein P879_11955 [Paragonimus westermani]|uniref:Large subunit ribosomal protein L20 n=1 Tax=Paragonimus westermani TaxID=34504 RepID=A0A8T0D5K7_9TREM|nr:hypothetical protein P879_11955 [Paragonimus westermani]